MIDIQPNENCVLEFEHCYMNHVQLLANIIDPNMLYAEWARATGKTEGKRIVKKIAL